MDKAIKGRRRLACWPAAIAILFILLMPMVPPAGGTSDIDLHAALCTTGNASSVPLFGKEFPSQHRTATHDGSCWFCISHPGWLPAYQVLHVPPSVVAFASIDDPAVRSLPPTQGFLIGRRTRAPPHLG